MVERNNRKNKVYSLFSPGGYMTNIQKNNVMPVMNKSVLMMYKSV
jgi:hypothetical protein